MAGSRRAPARPIRSRRGRRAGPTVLVALVILAGVSALYAWRHVATSGAGLPGGAQAIDPARFADGSCVAYPPTSGDRGQTVFLDAGHGGIDPGGVGTTRSGATVTEGDETLPVELDATALLRADGFRVVVSRTSDTTVLRLGAGDVDKGILSLQGAHDDVAARAQCANEANADVLVGIYYDAGASSQNAGSITAYDALRPFAAENRRLAGLVQADVLAGMNARGWDIPDDGVQTDGTLGSVSGSASDGGLAAAAAAYGHLMELGPAMSGFFTTPSTMPGIIVEPLYLTDPFEGSIADSATGQTVIARGIATAVEQFLAPPKGSSTAST